MARYKEKKREGLQTSGVYVISSLDGRCYVGSCINLSQRLANHLSALRSGAHHSRYLQNYVNKHGMNSVQFDVLEYCSKEKLLQVEQFYLDMLRPEFNTCPTAGSNLGRKFGKESKEKISRVTRGRILSEEHKAKISKGNLGRVVTEETRKKISAAQTGKKKANGPSLSRRYAGRPKPWLQGKHLSEEHKKKLSEAHKGKRASEETRRNMSASHKRRFMCATSS